MSESVPYTDGMAWHSMACVCVKRDLILNAQILQMCRSAKFQLMHCALSASFVRHSIIFQTDYINTPSKNREWCVLYMFHYLNMVDMVHVLGRKLPEVANDKHESFIIVSYDTSRLHRVVEYIKRVTNVGRCKYTKSMLLRFVSFYSETVFSRIAGSWRISKQYIRVHFLFICILFHWHSHMCVCVWERVLPGISDSSDTYNV